MANELVAVARFTDYIEAEMARQLLTDFGIEAVATGENTSNVYSVPAVEGPEVQVQQSQAEKAREILKSHNKLEQ